MQHSEPNPVLHIPTILGEGPIWSVEEGVLYWLDIFRPSINRFDPRSGDNRVIPVGETIYAAGFAPDGAFIASLDSGFALLDRNGVKQKQFANPNAGRPVNFNDGRVDRSGRFWSGTMAKDWTSPIGSLWRLRGTGDTVEMDGNVILANGIAFSPDDRVLYFTDFGRRTIYAYPFDIRSGTLGQREPVVVLPEGDGSPDGITVDTEGYIWVAHWDGWCVSRHDPKGRETARIHFPVPRPTSVAFGGDRLQTLYVTSAAMGLTADLLDRAPLSGALFAVETDATGLSEACFVT